MLPENQKIDFAPIEIPRVQRNPWGYAKIAVALLLIGGAVWAWQSGYRPPQLMASTKPLLELYEVDQGDIDVVVVETGTIESASTTPVRCRVEALIGTTSGTQGASGKTAGGMGGSSAQSGGAGGAQGGGGGSGGASQGGGGGSGKSSAKSSAKKKAGSSSSGGTSKSGSASSSGSSSSTGSSTSSSSSSSSTGSTSGSGGSSSGSSTGGSGGGTTAGSKPVIRSFNYPVVAHTPLRPVTPKAADSTATKKQGQGGMAGGAGGGGGGGGRGGGGGGGGGGRGGRGGGGRGMMGQEEEKPGSTRIIDIVPEGTKVKQGDVVCRLDSAALEDEEQAQQIRYLQAKSYVEQAQSMYEVALITLKEYRDGIFPADMQLVRQYIQTCQLEKERLERNLAWSTDMHKKGFRTSFQRRGDELGFEQAVIALKEAEGMLARLRDQTGPKIRKALEANVKAIQSDKLTQDAAFELEKQRLERIRRNIQYCTVVAPGDGIVVYVNQADWSGRVTTPIDQGVALRQDQPIFNLPDPKHMRVRAKVNESKVAMISKGLPARIHIDAYPQRPLNGVVGEINAINTPLNGSDVRVYYVTVDIREGFDDLRPGLSAEVSVLVDARRKVTRVPIEALRWSGDQPFVALHDKSLEASGSSKDTWRWQPVELGVSDTRFAEVLNGLKVGDQVVASARNLPDPKPLPAAPAKSDVADLSMITGNGN